eukprot:9369875-Lingulodinium_polyedra.AAC.1
MLKRATTRRQTRRRNTNAPRARHALARAKHGRSRAAHARAASGCAFEHTAARQFFGDTQTRATI